NRNPTRALIARRFSVRLVPSRSMALAIGGSPRRAPVRSAIKEGADALDRGEYTGQLMAADLDAYFDDITAP
ncbi:MAG: hypothetical protein WBV90_12245, partial [Terrimicrobiaceae bacterium]